MSWGQPVSPLQCPGYSVVSSKSYFQAHKSHDLKNVLLKKVGTSPRKANEVYDKNGTYIP